ncbi:hypothetical protein KKD03_03835 [Patescibacteria group bacterium]|nr:hypothetical protein [Patescibacteria group bacterium]
MNDKEDSQSPENEMTSTGGGIDQPKKPEFSAFSSLVDGLFDNFDSFIAGIDQERLKQNNLNPEEKKKIVDLIKAISSTLLSFRNEPGFPSLSDEEVKHVVNAEARVKKLALNAFMWGIFPDDFKGKVTGEESAEPKEDVEELTGEEKFKEWKVDFTDRMVELDDLIENASISADLYIMRDTFDGLYDEYIKMLDLFSGVFKGVEAFDKRFASQENKIKNKEQLVFLLDLQENVIEITNKKNEADYLPDEDINNLTRMLEEAGDSLQKISALESKKYKSGLLLEAKKLLDSLKELKENLVREEFNKWKIEIETDVSEKVDDFKLKFLPTSTKKNLEDLLIEIDTYIETIFSRKIKSDLVEEVGEVISKSENKVKDFRKEVESKLSKISGQEEFEKEEKAIEDFKRKVQKLVDLTKKVNDDGFSAANTKIVDTLKTKLEAEFTILVTAGVNSKSKDSYPRLEAIRVKIFGGDSDEGDYKKALDKLDRLKNDLDESMTLIEKQIHALNTHYNAQVNSTTETVISGNVRELKTLVEHQSSEFKALMNYYFRFRDGFYPNTTKNVPNTLMYGDSSSETRFAMRLLFNTPELIGFRSIGEVSFMDSDGGEHKIDVTKMVEKLEWYFDNINWQIGYYDSGAPKTFSYAKNGNPKVGELDNHGLSVPRIEERLSNDFPELENMPSFVLAAFRLFIPLSEMRKDSIVIDFAAYQVSPIPKIQDFEDLPVIAPMAQHLYNVQSSTFIDKGLQSYLFKLPTIETTTAIERHHWDNANTVVELPKDKVGFQMEMQDKVSYILPADVRNRDNIELSTQIEEVLRTFASPTEIGKVQLKTHLKILPSFYEIVKGEFDGKKLIYRPTLEEYNNLMKDIQAFYDLVSKDFRPLKNIDDLDTHVGELIASIKKFKGIFTVIETKKDELFTPYVQLLMLVYIKKLFNSYKGLIEKEKREQGVRYLNLKYLSERVNSPLHRFVEIVSPMLRSSKTLPQHLVDTEAGTTTEADATRYPLCGKIFDSILTEKEAHEKGLLKNAFKGSLKKFTYWGAFFDNSLSTSGIEETIKRFKNHSFFKNLEIYSREKNLAADESSSKRQP